MCRYLTFKENYQLLKPSSSRDMCRLIDSRSAGYVFDLSKSHSSKMNDFFALVEDLKNKYVFSSKYKGCVKTPVSNKIVIFANQLPNLTFLSIDRWSFFHTKLGQHVVSHNQ